MKICFDVDGVVCDDRHPELAYYEREPYPHAVEIIRKLKQEGHTIIFQTARYMSRFNGDQQRAKDVGEPELVKWFWKHEIPFDEVYFGKASADYYTDDRGCRLESNKGIVDWERFLSLISRRETTSVMNFEVQYYGHEGWTNIGQFEAWAPTEAALKAAECYGRGHGRFRVKLADDQHYFEYEVRHTLTACAVPQGG